MPDRAKKDRLTAARLTAYPRFRKSVTSKLAWSLRASAQRKKAMSTTPAAIGMMTDGAVQERVDEASMIP